LNGTPRLESDREQNMGGLASLPGLETVSEQLAGPIAVLRAEQARRQAGTAVTRPAWKNLVFTGGQLAVILAGREGPLRDMLNANPALAARFPAVINFPGYTALRIPDRYADSVRWRRRPAGRIGRLTPFSWSQAAQRLSSTRHLTRPKHAAPRSPGRRA